MNYEVTVQAEKVTYEIEAADIAAAAQGLFRYKNDSDLGHYISAANLDPAKNPIKEE
ncbi:MAG: hypothetical protein K1W17_03065 [Oscillospiraceae bacterium]